MTASSYSQVGFVRTDVDTCDLCGSHATRAVVIRHDQTGNEFYASGRCAKTLLGYNPFARGRQCYDADN